MNEAVNSCDKPSRQRFISHECKCEACRNASKVYHREWRKKRGSLCSEYHAEWYRRDLDNNRAKRAGVNERRRKETLSLLGDRCVRCGFSDWRALQVDHIDGGGVQHRESIGHSASSLLKAVRDTPSMFQLLCANCNWIKRYENNELKIGRRWQGRKIQNSSVEMQV